MRFLLHFLFSDIGSKSHFKTLFKGCMQGTIGGGGYYFYQPLCLSLNIFIALIIFALSVPIEVLGIWWQN